MTTWRRGQVVPQNVAVQNRAGDVLRYAHPWQTPLTVTTARGIPSVPNESRDLLTICQEGNSDATEDRLTDFIGATVMQSVDVGVSHSVVNPPASTILVEVESLSGPVRLTPSGLPSDSITLMARASLVERDVTHDLPAPTLMGMLAYGGLTKGADLSSGAEVARTIGRTALMAMRFDPESPVRSVWTGVRVRWAAALAVLAIRSDPIRGEGWDSVSVHAVPNPTA